MTQQDMDRVKRAVIRKYPIFASTALFGLTIQEDKDVSTVMVWGEKNSTGGIDLKGINYSSDFFDSLTFDQQVFVLAHEICHIAFKHFSRSQDKPKKDIERKYQEYCERVVDKKLRKIKKIKLHRIYNNIWNIATDACINAFLKKDGLNMPTDVIDKKTGKRMEFVNVEDGLFRSAERIYDVLVKKVESEKENDTSDKGLGQGSFQNTQVGGGLDDIDIDSYQGIDCHDAWVSEPQKVQDISEISKSLDKDLDNKAGKPLEGSIDEAMLFKKNEVECEKHVEKSLQDAFIKITEEAGCSHVQITKPILSWKQLLICQNEEEVERWGFRRASRFRPNARIESRIQDDRAITEVVLDASVSVSDILLRVFLCQLVPLFKETEIKVGCFGAEFHGFTELQSMKQVMEFRAIRDYSGTNFEAAATAFTKDNGNKKINKFVFTDGILDGCQGHRQRTKVDDIIWVVFGEEMDFEPVGGKIIRVSEKDLNQILNTAAMSYMQLNDVQINNTEVAEETSKLKR
ncbi:MAG: hypothetical protein HFG15_03885 [Bacilli bacterium]|nr:hypothetical protein [Bacilli bacterium]